MLTAGFLTLLVMGVLFPNLWYGMHDITDLPVYWGYAARIAQGEAPFTSSFQVEYPPLAVALFRVPGHTGSESLYGIWFNILMGAITVATGGRHRVRRLPPLAARRARLRRRGPLPRRRRADRHDRVNRYDVAVALLIAIFLLCLVGRWYTAAGFVLGMGFALKLTPLALLPLVLLLAGPPRRWAWPLVAFGAAAVAPFLPYLLNRGVRPLVRVPVPPRAAAADRERRWGRRSCSASCSAPTGRRGPGATAPTPWSPRASASPPTCPAA